MGRIVIFVERNNNMGRIVIFVERNKQHGKDCYICAKE